MQLRPKRARNRICAPRHAQKAAAATTPADTRTPEGRGAERRLRVNYRYYNPTDGRWTRRDPIGIEGGKKIVYTKVGRDAVVNSNGMTVRDHEMQHVNIASSYWDAFVSESKKMEGCYCSLECVTLGMLVTKYAYLLNQGYSIRDNALYDIKEYGENRGGEILSELTAKYNKALSIIQENRPQYNEYMKQYQESKCSKM